MIKFKSMFERTEGRVHEGGLFNKIIRLLLNSSFVQEAIPPMDGPLRPNSRLDECPGIGGEIAEPDDIAIDGNGSLFVSTGNRILSLTGEEYTKRKTVAEFGGLITGLTTLSDGGLAVCVTGHGICFIGGKRDGKSITMADGESIKCPLTITAAVDETLYITEGSRHHTPDKWVFDLMLKGATGRLIMVEPGRDKGITILDALCWPYGVTLTPDGRWLLLTESWRHSLSRISLEDKKELRREEILGNLPGYPARIVATPDGGYWFCLFALRSQLVELVLQDKKYRTEMIQTIDPAFWIAPALKSTEHMLEPLQYAGIKHWGLKKAWAPPRSYGLIVQLDSNLKPVTSLHSRIDGKNHGITGLAAIDAGVLAVSKGGDRILMVNNGAIQ
jgi:hypothetical protein